VRLWHQSIIPLLPRQQLLGQHRECCALRGKGWGRKHSVVDYVFTHEPDYLVAYHYLVMAEMERRGYKPDKIWRNADYRGKELGFEENWCEPALVIACTESEEYIYPEHNDNYLNECLENLRQKGIR
jgi:uncharacterized protein (TIGR02328 family)